MKGHGILKSLAKKPAPEHIKANYERLHSTHLHYETLIYSATAPLFALCLTLGGVVLGAGGLSVEVRLFGAIGGFSISFYTFVTVQRLRRYIVTMTRKMIEIEKTYEYGFWTEIKTTSALGLWRIFPTNMFLRSAVFAMLAAYFATYLYLTLLEVIKPV